MLTRVVRPLLVLIFAVVGVTVAPTVAVAVADDCQTVEVTRDDGSIEYRTVCPEGGAPGDGAPGDGGTGSQPSCDESKIEDVANYTYCAGTTACAVNNASTLGEDAWPMDERPTPEHIYTWTWCEDPSGEVDNWWSWYLPE